MKNRRRKGNEERRKEAKTIICEREMEGIGGNGVKNRGRKRDEEIKNGE